MTQIANPDGKIFLALKGRMDAFIPAFVYYSPNVPQQPGATTPYLIVNDVRLEADTRYTESDAPDEYRGVLNVAVMVPVKWTAAQGSGLCGNVADHFEKGAWYRYDDMLVQVLKRPRIIGAAYVDNGMHRYQVQVTWRAVG